MSVSKVDKLHLTFGWGRSLEDYEIEIKTLSSPKNLRLQLPDEIKDCLSDYLSSDNELEQLTSQHFSLEKEYRKQQYLKQSDLEPQDSDSLLDELASSEIDYGALLDSFKSPRVERVKFDYENAKKPTRRLDDADKEDTKEDKIYKEKEDVLSKITEKLETYVKENVGLTMLESDDANFLWLYDGWLWKTKMDYTEEQIKLLILDEVEKERRKFERLKKIHIDHEEIVKSRRERIPKEVRQIVWYRDEGKCVECGRQEDLQYDHIIPVTKGGSNTEKNIQLLCAECNRKKRDKIGG